MTDIGSLEETFELYGVTVRVFAKEDPAHGGVLRIYDGIEQALATPEARAESARSRLRAMHDTSPIFVSGSMSTV